MGWNTVLHLLTIYIHLFWTSYTSQYACCVCVFQLLIQWQKAENCIIHLEIKDLFGCGLEYHENPYRSAPPDSPTTKKRPNYKKRSKALSSIQAD